MLYWPLLDAVSRDLDRRGGRGAVAQASSARVRALPLNVFRTENEVVVTAELPGVDPDGIEISVEERVVTITAERKPVELGEEDAYLVRERRSGKVARSVRLPFDVDADAITARHTHGVLKVTLPRSESGRPRTIPVDPA